MSDTSSDSPANEPVPPMVLPGRQPRSDRPSRSSPSPTQSNGFGRLVMLLFLLLSLGLNFVLCLVLGGMMFASAMMSGGDDGLVIKEKHWSGNPGAHDKVAIIRIEGVLLDEAMGYTEKQIEKAAKDSDVKAIVVRINSPGGTITSSDDIHKRLTELRDGTSPRISGPKTAKPVVASFGPTAASGGYYIAMPAKHIFAERTTITGSIGVYASFINIHKLAEDHGVKMELVKAGDVKGAGSMFRDLKPEERQMWQDMVDNAYSQFITVVEDGRSQLKGKLTKRSRPRGREGRQTAQRGSGPRQGRQYPPE